MRKPEDLDIMAATRSRRIGDESNPRSPREHAAQDSTEEAEYPRAERRHPVIERSIVLFALFFTALAMGAAITSAIIAFRALEAVTRSADTAREANRISQDTAKRQLRAYLGFSPGHVTQFAANQQFKSENTVKNYGLTPAYNVAITHGARVEPRSPAASYNVPGHLIMTTKTDATILPQHERTSRLVGAAALTEAQYNDIVKGAMVLVHQGTIEYVDIFKTHRFTNFCFFYGVDEIKVGYGSLCTNYNNADDDGE
jgi:hypothetical protein